MHYICKDCKAQFELTDGEIEFYKSKGLSLPKRCKSCREKNKADGNGQGENIGGNKAADSKSAGSKGDSKAGLNKGGNKQGNKKSGDILSDVRKILPDDDKGSGKGSSAFMKKILPTAVFIAVAIVVMLVVKLTGGNKAETPTPSADGAASYSSSADDTADSTDNTADTAVVTTEYANSYGDETYFNEEDTTASTSSDETVVDSVYTYTFANKKLLEQHYQKHGIEMGFASAEEYEAAASAVVNNPDALHKTEAEDGDDVYYITATNEFVVVSTYGNIRTYFNPDSGIAYYNKQ